MRTASKLLALGLLGGKGIFPFADGFNRSDGSVGSGWSGATWTISGGKAINTPVLGDELIANGGFAADTDWTKEDGWTIAGGVATKGSSDQANRKVSQDVLTANVWYRCVYTVASLVDGVARPYFHASYSGGGAPVDGTYTATMYATGVTAGILGTGDVTTMDLDNVSFKEVPLDQCFLARDFGVATVRVSATGMIVLRGNRAGVVLNLDDPDDPQNFVLGVHDGGPLSGQAGTLALHKCVNGVMSQVSASSSVDYVEGATISLRKSGTTYTLAYAGEDEISQTIADASIVSNTYHGLFSAHESCQFASVTVTPS